MWPRLLLSISHNQDYTLPNRLQYPPRLKPACDNVHIPTLQSKNLDTLQLVVGVSLLTLNAAFAEHSSISYHSATYDSGYRSQAEGLLHELSQPLQELCSSALSETGTGTTT